MFAKNTQHSGNIEILKWYRLYIWLSPALAYVPACCQRWAGPCKHSKQGLKQMSFCGLLPEDWAFFHFGPCAKWPSAGSWSFSDSSLHGCQGENFHEGPKTLEGSLLQTSPINKVKIKLLNCFTHVKYVWPNYYFSVKVWKDTKCRSNESQRRFLSHMSGCLPGITLKSSLNKSSWLQSGFIRGSVCLLFRHHFQSNNSPILRNQLCFTASTYFAKNVSPPGLTGTPHVPCAGQMSEHFPSILDLIELMKVF